VAPLRSFAATSLAAWRLFLNFMLPPKTPFFRTVGLAFICGALAAASLFAANLPESAAPTRIKKVLYFTKCSNFEHSVVKKHGGELSWSEQVFAALGPKHGIEFTFSKDGSLFTPKYLAQFDAFCFYTSGDLLAPGKDGNPPMTPAGKAALLDAIKGGKGFIGIHAAADTFHTGETVETDTNRARTWRYKNFGAEADPYTRMLGAGFIIHDAQQVATARVIDPKFPGLQNAGASFNWMEEWYSLNDFSPDMHVILVTDTAGMTGPPYKRAPYPNTWARLQGKGRVFFTALGHREDTWANPLFQEIVFGGIAWAVHNVDADLTPNLAKVTPNYAELPPVSGPVPGLPKGSDPASGLKTPFDRNPVK
jgi:type 1 glutamine amidotransferase